MGKSREDILKQLDGLKAADVNADRSKENLNFKDYLSDIEDQLKNAVQAQLGSLKNKFHVSFVLDSDRPYLFIEDFSNWGYRGTDHLNVRIGVKAKGPSGRIFYKNIKDDDYVNSPDLNCESVNYTRVNNNVIYLPLLDSGNPERGEYKIELHERKLVDGASWTSANVSSAQRKVHTIIYDYQYVKPDVNGKYEVDVAVPVLKSIETTDYNIGEEALGSEFKITSCIQSDTDEYAIGIESNSTQPFGSVFPVSEPVILHSNSNANGVYSVKKILGYGDAENISALSGAVSTSFYIVLDGLNEFIDQFGSVSTKQHILNYPIELGVNPLVSYGDRLVTNDFYTERHQSNISNRVIWKMNDDVSIVDAVQGSFSYSVVAQADLCDVYCCLEDIYNRWQSHKLSNKVLAEKFKDRLYEALIYLPLLVHAIDCNEGERISELREKIMEIADCDPACFCDDKKPKKVFALLTSNEQEIVEGRQGVFVERRIDNGIITYSVEVDPVLYANIQKKYEALVGVTGTNLSVVDSGVPGDPLTGVRTFTISYTPATIEVPNEISFVSAIGTLLPSRKGTAINVDGVGKFTDILFQTGSGDLYDSRNDVTVTSSLTIQQDQASWGTGGWLEEIFEYNVSNFGITNGQYSVLCSLDMVQIPNDSLTDSVNFDSLLRIDSSLEDLESQLGALESDLNKKASELAKDKAKAEAERNYEVEKYNVEIDKIKAEINSLKTMEASREAEIDSLRSDVSTLKEQAAAETNLAKQLSLTNQARQKEAQAGAMENELSQIKDVRSEKVQTQESLQRDQVDKMASQGDILQRLSETKEEEKVAENQFAAAEKLASESDDLRAESEIIKGERDDRAAEEFQREQADDLMKSLKDDIISKEQDINKKISDLQAADEEITDLSKRLEELERERDAADFDTGQEYGSGDVSDIEDAIDAATRKQQSLSLVDKYTFYPFVYDKQNSSFKIRLLNLFARENFTGEVRCKDLVGTKFMLNILITKLD